MLGHTAHPQTEYSQRPLVAEILAHPSYPDTIWKLTPTQSGLLPVAADRGGPINIDWEVHGTGDTKVIWIMGLGSLKSGWQRQTLHFGHEHGDKYSSLIFDNRGMGKSDKPIMRYSTSEMAKDAIELIDHLGWTNERQLHVAGVSMGGMIAQELAYLIPARIASLSLLSTAAAIENTTTFLENMSTRIRMFIPKTLDRSVSDSAHMLFSDAWLDKVDDAVLPTSKTPNVELPPSGAYARFATNYERFAAQELNKRLNAPEFQKKGFMLQAIAAGWHYKSASQLSEIGDKVGRNRILVIHGTKDNMITVPLGRKLIDQLKPGMSEIKEGIGHVFMLEETEWLHAKIEELVRKVEALETK
ncbi:unnamed protein product [Diplocarpon coronariae]|uniref:AB hydrolase-1 domain-containing protein n=1 Tax=Diplocarpon coronariae TaxID=2795749 RepID=A0A218YYC7_9HELO|nr:hypothetical protein JHW43_005765 [Diplocarpon mali]OWP00025.1 hypothetical protein B2J93_2372 [Marssonina coronariae]